MRVLNEKMLIFWSRLGPEMLPFADISTDDLPMRRILRLSLFQVSAGMALVLITGTLNRVLIVELGVQAWFVALMVALPVVFAPLRALIAQGCTAVRTPAWRWPCCSSWSIAVASVHRSV